MTEDAFVDTRVRGDAEGKRRLGGLGPTLMLERKL